MSARSHCLVLLLLGTLGSGCGGGLPEDRKTADGRSIVSVQLNWFPEPEFGGFYEAQRQGFDRDAGLELVLLAGGPNVPAVQMVASGRTHFAIASADEVVAARARGVPIVAVFAVYQTSPTGIMVRASSGIETLADVFAPREPKLTLAVLDAAFVSWLRKQYDFSNVRQVIYQGGVSQFVRDPDYAQQCFVTSEPFAAEAAGVPTRAFLVAESGFNPYSGLVIVQEDFLVERGETVQAFIQAVHKGWERYLEQPEPANTIMLPMNPGETAETFSKAAERQIDLIRTPAPLGSMTLARWRTLIDQMAETDVIEEPIDAAGCFRNVLVDRGANRRSNPARLRDRPAECSTPTAASLVVGCVPRRGGASRG